MAKIYGMDYEGLRQELKRVRKKGKRKKKKLKVIMVSGTFDLCHYGHMKLFYAAKKQGDILIVAVKSDNGAARKKVDPPVLNQDIRMETVSYIDSVDYVILVDFDRLRMMDDFVLDNVSSFEWLNMFEPAVKAIKPDVFVHEDNKAIANARKQLFERYNVKGVIQPRTQGVSTTEIIDKIKTRVLIQLQKDMHKQ